MDEIFMKIALEEAKKGISKVNPNPLVGAVIVKNNKIISTGFHEKFAHKHAEIRAIENATESLENSTLYVNLEPCSHFGKTGPCADEIIKSKIKRVVISMKDPNPIVSGKGIEKLKDAGIEVKLGVLNKEAMILNEKFYKYIKNKMPFIALKTAMTLDGKIACENGESRWITGIKSRQIVHELRNEYTAVMVSSNTILKDDPKLDVRLVSKIKNPKKIILDPNLKTPFKAKIFEGDSEVYILTLKKHIVKQKLYLNKNVNFINLEKFDLENINKAMRVLALKHQIDSILLETGGIWNQFFLRNKMIDKLYIFIAPKILGGKDSIGAFSGENPPSLDFAKKIKIENLEYSEDIFITAYLKE